MISRLIQQEIVIMQQNKKFIDTLQEEIQTRMESKNLSIRELERKSGLNVGAVQNIINGRSTNPGIEFISAIAKALNCSVDDLIDSSSPPKTEDNPNKTPVAWNASLYKDCTNKVEESLKDNNLIPESDKILELIKDAYIYSLECNEGQADLKFIKWLINKNFK